MASQERFFLAGVMGWPVMHSRSPLLHGYWLRKHGFAGAYVPLEIPIDGLSAALRALPALGFSGCNLTIPHKVEALKILDRRRPAGTPDRCRELHRRRPRRLAWRVQLRRLGVCRKSRRARPGLARGCRPRCGRRGRRRGAGDHRQPARPGGTRNPPREPHAGSCDDAGGAGRRSDRGRRLGRPRPRARRCGDGRQHDEPGNGRPAGSRPAA